MAKSVKGESNFDMLSDEKFIQTLPDEEAPASAPRQTNNDNDNESKEDDVFAEVALPNTPAKAKTKEPTAAELEAALKKREKDAADSEKNNTEEKDGTKDTKDAEIVVDKKDGEKAKDDKKSDTKEADKEPELSFESPNDIKKPEGKEGENYSWKELAKEKFGVDIPEDNEDSFVEAVNNKAETNLSKHSPETQRLYKFTEAGGSTDDFIEPFAKVDALLSMDPAELVRKDYEGRDKKVWTAEKIEARINFLTENDGLDGEYNLLKEKLVNYRDGVKNEIIENRIKAKEIADQKAANAFKDEAKHIKSQLDTRKEFMETPLNDKNREYIAKKYENGDYEKDFKDPKQIADFLLWKEFGKKGEANLRQKIQSEVKKSYQAERHNVPLTNGATAGSVRSTPSGQDSEGGFGFLEKERV